MTDGQILRSFTCHIITPLDSSIGQEVSSFVYLSSEPILVTTFLDIEESNYEFHDSRGNSTDRFKVERTSGCVFEPGFEQIGKFE